MQLLEFCEEQALAADVNPFRAGLPVLNARGTECDHVERELRASCARSTQGSRVRKDRESAQHGTQRSPQTGTPTLRNLAGNSLSTAPLAGNSRSLDGERREASALARLLAAGTPPVAVSRALTRRRRGRRRRSRTPCSPRASTTGRSHPACKPAPLQACKSRAPRSNHLSRIGAAGAKWRRVGG